MAVIQYSHTGKQACNATKGNVGRVMANQWYYKGKGSGEIGYRGKKEWWGINVGIIKKMSESTGESNVKERNSKKWTLDFWSKTFSKKGF